LAAGPVAVGLHATAPEPRMGIRFVTASKNSLRNTEEELMKTRTILASLAVFLAGYALCFAADAYTGTWKLNDAKSKFSPGATKNNTVVYAPAGDMVKVTVDGVDKDGKAEHNEWTGKFDGKDYPVTGSTGLADSRSYTKVDDHTMNMTLKKAGKVVGTGKIAVSADGKSRTVTTMASDPNMTAMNNTAVYDKQ
jgi:hypothetical protein